MAWNYSGDPSTSPLDEVRFLIGDTRAAYGYLSDEEINYTLQKFGGNASSAAINCCEGLLARFASDVHYSIGPEKVYASDRYEHYKSLLADMRKNKSDGNAIVSMADPIEPISFDVGMHDNR